MVGTTQGNERGHPTRRARERMVGTAGRSPFAAVLALLVVTATPACWSLTLDDFNGKNIVLFITDQERHLMHFPPDWAATHLPGLTRLQRTGLTFNNSFTSASMCSAARASLFSGLLPAQHGVRYVLEQPMPEALYPQVDLPTDLPNLATVAAAAGYKFVYKGKIHLFKPSRPDYVWQASDAERYGFTRWNYPDTGANQSLSEAGGGTADNDQRIMYGRGSMEAGEEGALQFIQEVAPTWAQERQPFFLVISLVNPHDVLFYPWNTGVAGRPRNPGEAELNGTGYDDSMLQGPLGRPPTAAEDIRATKPPVQAQFRTLMAVSGPTASPAVQKKYVNFYGNLMMIVDGYLLDTVKALEQAGLLNDTLVIRTSDHGEVGMAHGGLRQKMFNMYEESIRVPLVFSNPRLFPQAYTSQALLAHIDLLPTLATLMGAPPSARHPSWPGTDCAALLLSPGSTRAQGQGLQDHVVFTFDDFQAGQSKGPYVQGACSHIVAVREQRYKLAMYYDPIAEVSGVQPQYEMYDLLNDPYETNNLAYDGKYGTSKQAYNRTAEEEAQYQRLLTKLQEVLRTTLAPLPRQHQINLNASTATKATQQGGSGEGVTAIVTDKGSISGVPIGQGSITLNFTMRADGTADVAFTIVAANVGVIHGTATTSFQRTNKAATFNGTARFVGGSGVFQGISAEGLAFKDTNTLSGQNGKVWISGNATY